MNSLQMLATFFQMFTHPDFLNRLPTDIAQNFSAVGISQAKPHSASPGDEEVTPERPARTTLGPVVFLGQSLDFRIWIIIPKANLISII